MVLRSCGAFVGGLLAAIPLAGQQAAAVDPGLLVRDLAVPQRRAAAVQGLLQAGPAAVPALHKALVDPRPEVVQWALFTCASLPGDVASLREPIARHLQNKNLGIALAARGAWPVLEGGGVTLVADAHRNAVVEIAADGSVTELVQQPFVMGAMRLPDGHLLVAAYEANRVVEFDRAGVEVWQCAGLSQPSDAERLPGGHTLIADSGHGRVIEVDRQGEVVWTYGDDVRPIDADRLGNGNTLIASYEASGVVEVDPQGAVVWRYPAGNVRDADRQLDGTTLLVLTDEGRVVQVGVDRQVQREWKVAFRANDAELLANGHLVVGGERCVVEFGPDGGEVWRAEVAYAGRVARLGVRPAPRAPR